MRIKNLKDKLKAKLKWKNIKTNTKVVCFLLLFITFCNLLAIFCGDFAEWYRKYCFSYISVFWSRISNLTTVSIGEVLICLGILHLILFVVIGLVGFIKAPICKKIRRLYFRWMVYVILFVYATETFHCFILYHTETIEDNLLATLHSKENAQNTDSADNNSIISIQDYHTDAERLLAVYNEVTRQLNALSLKLERNSNGELVNHFTYEECKEALRNVSNEFEYLKGYYPNPKKIYYSNIMSQQYLAGIYFPFSMEANYNQIMYNSNFPSTICHELSHLKGYIREDEANFIAYVACIHSENEFIQYSGYLSVYYYLMDDLMEYGNEEIYMQMEEPNEYVMADDIFLTAETFDEVEENAIISTEVWSEASDAFVETNLKMNGIESGMDNYNEVVRLLILYYELNGIKSK